ncbi:hypothetical protein ACF07V_19065 [Streptomyces sp. NPDC015661]|uniref:hypothetical protein n=1 Tax=Streptomyces sp. NPDC015661 TaxID=3364961 RepID=UPI0036FB4233
MRAAIFAAVCVLLAAVGHVLMSGQAVPGWVLSLAFTGTVAVAWFLAGRERGLFAVTATTVAVQSVLHTAFSWSQPTAAMPADTGRTAMAHTHMAQAALQHAGMAQAGMSHAGMAHAGMAHAGMAQASMQHSGLGHAAMQQHMAMGHEAVARVGTAMTEAPATHDMTDWASSFGMLSAHLLAALLSGLWMAYGERAVFRVLRALPLGLFRPLRLLLAAVVPVPPRRSRVRPGRARDERAPRRLLLAHSVISRGPPQALAVL